MDEVVSLQSMPNVRAGLADSITLVECKSCRYYETCPVMNQLDKEIDQVLNEHMVGA